MKNIFIIGGIIIVLLFGGVWWSANLQESDPDVLSRNGLHWHPTLEIYVKDKKIEIPANVGVGTQYAGLPTYHTGMRMTAMHSHDDLPVIHLEFQDIVRKEDLTLGNFFKIWGKDMQSFGSSMRMTVNGVPNEEYERYMMRDKDRIELRYE
jgi:hypothetical protein